MKIVTFHFDDAQLKGLFTCYLTMGKFPIFFFIESSCLILVRTKIQRNIEFVTKGNIAFAI